MNAEIHLNEPFGYEIFQTVVKYDLKKNLEIGSWDGEGSTSCFVAGMKLLTGHKRLDCIEIVEDKFNILKRRYDDIDFVKPFKGSSISFEDLKYKDFETIYNSIYYKIPDMYSRDTVEEWFKRDLENIKNVPHFLTNDVENYDSVLIDGSEFTGYSEFLFIKDKCRIIFLDDVHYAFKCSEIYADLSNTDNWKLLKERSDVRNGFAIFINES